MFKAQQQIARGLYVLQKEVKKYGEDSLLKLQAMQEAYLRKTDVSYTNPDIEAIRYYLNALIHKFHTATLGLEQLWGLSYDTRSGLVEAIEQSFDKLTVSDDELALISGSILDFVYLDETSINNQTHRKELRK